jgi:phosphatidylinositol alpha 1,6-mannosyltransferase
VNSWPRIAFFTDSFHGVDGVGTTSRNLVAAACRREIPLFSVRAGKEKRHATEGSTEILELPRGPFSFRLDIDLSFDLAFWRYYQEMLRAVREFRADLVHITGPGDLGIPGALIAHELKLPLVASWHTNLHEFAGRRLRKLCKFLPEAPRDQFIGFTEDLVLRACLRFYQIARVILAPNQEQVRMLRERVGKPVFPMHRGVDSNLFSPLKRTVEDGIFRLGYLGRLRPEKNVRFLVEIERALLAQGLTNFRFLIVGDGSERPWLEANLQHADFRGVLRGEALASEVANMDLFVFTSETDTFGNVVLESTASGVPVIVTSKGGPKFQVEQGVTGFVAEDAADFIAKVKLVMTSPGMHVAQRHASRRRAAALTWDHMLDEVHEAYNAALTPAVQTAQPRKQLVAGASH